MSDTTYNLIKSPFDMLALGARFSYEGNIDKVWVKISYDKVAEWDDYQINTKWIGQHICSAFDYSYELGTEVIIHS